MHQIRSRGSRGQRVAVLALVLGGALILAGGYLLLPEDSPESATVKAPSVTLQPRQLAPNSLPESFEDLTDPENAGVQSGLTSAPDPLSVTSGDTSFHNIRIVLTSRGPMKYAYEFEGKRTGVRTADGRTTISKRLRGPLPAARAYVQAYGRSATCTIYVDGSRVSSATAKKQFQGVVCAG